MCVYFLIVDLGFYTNPDEKVQMLMRTGESEGHRNDPSLRVCELGQFLYKESRAAFEKCPGTPLNWKIIFSLFRNSIRSYISNQPDKEAFKKLENVIVILFLKQTLIERRENKLLTFCRLGRSKELALKNVLNFFQIVAGDYNPVIEKVYSARLLETIKR